MPSLVIIAAVVLAAALAPWVSPYSPSQIRVDRLLQAPSRAHLLGTDDLGRDVLSRTIYGARIAISVGTIAVTIGLGGGLLLGLIAGYYGGWWDMAIMRVMDAILAFPGILLALALVSAFGQGFRILVLALGLMAVPTYARLSRGEVLSVRQREFVESARASGASDFRLLSRHVLPNITSPLIVQSTLNLATAILSEAGLSFLGFGVPPPTPSWGGMVSTALRYIERASWMVFAPGVAIFIVVLAFNFLGDALRDTLDPKLRG